jgi:hypothetical protein
MNRIIYFCALLLFVSGCLSVEELRDDNKEKIKQAFTIEEAKEFFEEAYTSQFTKAGSKVSDVGLSPGDFTPLWDTGIYESSETTASYDVRISSNRKIRALRVGECGNTSYAQKVDVYQKLVVVKSLKDGTNGSYVLSLIPDAGSDYGYRVLSDFVNMRRVKGRFTGIAVYTTLVGNAILKVDRYVLGQKVDGVFLGDTNLPMNVLCHKCVSLLSGMNLKRITTVRTKVGEDDWGQYNDDYDYGDPYTGYEDVGFGVFTDGNGNWAIDIDDDGVPDMPCLPPSYEIDDQNPNPDDEPTFKFDDGCEEKTDVDSNEEASKMEGDNSNQNPDEDDLNSWKSTPFDNIDLMDPEDFVKYSESKDCLKGCKEMMDNMGYEGEYGSSNEVIYLVRENSDHSALENYGNNVEENYKNAVECINDHLEDDRPVIVGTDNELGNGYNDGTIDHFVLIVGSGYDEELDENYYIYVEPGTNSLDKGVDPEENRFYYDEETGMFVDESDRNGDVLTLTEIRPNNGEDYDTICQPSK